MLVSHYPGKPPSQAGFDEFCQAISIFAILTQQYQHYTFHCGCQAQEQQEGGHTQFVDCEYQQLLTQRFQPLDLYIQAQAQPQQQAYQQRSIVPLASSSQIFATEPSYGLDLPRILPSQIQEQMMQVSSSHYWSTDESPEMRRYQQTVELWRERSHLGNFAYDNSRLQQFQAHVGSGDTPIPFELTPRGHHVRSQPVPYSGQVLYQRPSPQYTLSGRAFHTLPLQLRHYHHHKLPSQARGKAQRTGNGEASPAAEERDSSSVIGQPGMPAPAARQYGPKLKFTSKDDALLVDLKETKNLTWKQIADFFPGRSSGTLQVRYCTKLKAQDHRVDGRNGAPRCCHRRIREH